MKIRKINGIKTLFVESRFDIKLKNLDKIKIKEKRIGLVCNIQTYETLGLIKTYLEKKKHKVFIGGQILGCNVSNVLKIKDKIDALLFIGSGVFHPLELINKIKVKNYYLFNPITSAFSVMNHKEIDLFVKKKNAKLAKYLISKKIGILVSTKPGQEKLNLAIDFCNKCDKESYIFLENNLDLNKLEDFPGIDYWVNTACPRLEGKGIISLRDILDFNQKI
jgi:2-(3-amino-3-carboxypropyl)histidine synthase